MTTRRDIDFPWHLDAHGHTATVDADGHIRDLVEQVLFTNPGERVNRPDFGSGLLQLVFAPNSPELAAALQFSMRAALQRWLGDLLEVQELEVTSVDAAIHVEVTYQVRVSGVVRTDEFVRGGGG